METEQTTERGNLAVPIAIVIAAGLIAGALYLKDDSSSGSNQAANVADAPDAAEEIDIRPVDESDHIRGNPNAPILIVEYSDYDCPFCKQFHETMIRVMEEYGEDGEVAWVYRHFPLTQLHPNAAKIAEASECVAELGGNSAFWQFTDTIFNEKPVNDFTEMSQLPTYAAEAGVDRNEFNLCYQSGKYGEKVQDSVQEAVTAGGRGTPHSIIIIGDQTGVINGAQPYGQVKQIIDNLLEQIS